jgi:hypothetical protein
MYTTSVLENKCSTNQMKIMKMLMCALMVMVGSGIAGNAQDEPTPPPSDEAVSTEQQDEKVMIKSEELPEAVKTTLEGDEYKGWLINSAYHDAKKETYEVELKNGAETQVVKFNKDGEKIDE